MEIGVGVENVQKLKLNTANVLAAASICSGDETYQCCCPFARTGNLPCGPHFTNLVLCELSLISIVVGSIIHQKVGNLLSEPKSLSNIGKFGYPITALCWPRGKQRADCLYVLSDLIPLVLHLNISSSAMKFQVTASMPDSLTVKTSFIS